MTVRLATHDDIPRIVEMAGRFYATTGYARICPMSQPSAAGLAIMTMESGVMLLAESNGAVVGMACLYIEPFTFNVSITVATELAWWIEPESRGGLLALELLRRIDSECKDRGVDVIRMAALVDSPPQAAALYERLGYAQSDTFYTKVLE